MTVICAGAVGLHRPRRFADVMRCSEMRATLCCAATVLQQCCNSAVTVLQQCSDMRATLPRCPREHAARGIRHLYVICLTRCAAGHPRGFAAVRQSLLALCPPRLPRTTPAPSPARSAFLLFVLRGSPHHTGPLPCSLCFLALCPPRQPAPSRGRGAAWRHRRACPARRFRCTSLRGYSDPVAKRVGPDANRRLPSQPAPTRSCGCACRRRYMYYTYFTTITRITFNLHL